MVSSRTVRWFLFLCLGTLGLFAYPNQSTLAQEKGYPKKPIKLMVPYGPGGATDLAARALVSVIPEFLGQPVIVVNRPGGGGSICFSYVKKSKPDGYTMMMAAIGANVLTPAMNPALPFKYNDLVAVARTQINPNVFVVKADAPWKSMRQVLDHIKANPGKLKYSTAGPGSVQNFGIVTLLEAAGLPKGSAIEVPFDSGGRAVAALLGGHVDIHQTNLAPAIGHIKAGSVRALAVTTPKRLKDLPGVPTYTELGFPVVDTVGWRGIVGPPGLPDYVVKKWAEAVEKTTKHKAWRRLVTKLGDKIGYLGTQEFTRFRDKEFKRYRRLATKLGILVK